jgi:hypothetical protein
VCFWRFNFCFEIALKFSVFLWLVLFVVQLVAFLRNLVVDVAKIGGLVLVAGSVGWYLGHKGELRFELHFNTGG